MTYRRFIRKLSLVLSVSANILLVSKIALGNPAAPKDNE